MRRDRHGTHGDAEGVSTVEDVFCDGDKSWPPTSAPAIISASELWQATHASYGNVADGVAVRAAKTRAERMKCQSLVVKSCRNDLAVRLEGPHDPHHRYRAK